MDLSQIQNPHRRPAWLIEVLALFSAVWFRFELRGAEHVPRTTVIFAGNHSALGMVDVMCLAPAFLTRLSARRIIGMMHDLFIRAPIVGRISRALGAVRAHPDNARAALDAGHDVFCFPGGGYDSCRPFTRARSVELGAHRGYVRLALEKGVPIVPVATIGSAYSYLLLPGTERLAKWLGAHKWARNERLPIPIAAIAAIAIIGASAIGLLPWWSIVIALLAIVIPNPVRVTTELLEPNDVSALTAHLSDATERVEAAHRLVNDRLARAVAAMQHGDRELIVEVRSDSRRSFG